ncbi:Mfa1 family fimbria major subunit [Pedobacter sp. N36a]|uniref:Mfa1 family fimbria major subunit n=1 Tax=Pedobacter sp. N36a TaxID=2767996 RepID=UPI0016571103|nr:Mfa1 family fimbria major subunit [Pedobacter sp. N36a]MBC8986319.1 Mfa1 family fimbria major subunit [Pedobacter sp. N36a]
MKRILKNCAFTALAALTLAACKKDQKSEVNFKETNGKDARLQLMVSAPKSVFTYAAGDANATDAEMKINTLDVFVYDDGAPFTLTSYTHIDGNDIYEADGKTIKAQSIEVKTGAKQVFVGVNLAQEIVNKLKSNYANMNTALNVDMATLVNGDGSVAMFNESINRISVSEDQAANKITVPVSRLVAKTSVKSGQSLMLSNISGGNLSELNYTIGQANTKQIVAPLVNFKDANWIAADHTGSDLRLVDISTFIPLNVASATVGSQNVMYAPENTSKEHQYNQVTYLSVRGKFTPSVLTGTKPIEANGTFYAVFTNYGVYYFGSLQEAQQHADENGGAAPITYSNGYCYYRLYLNPEGSVMGEGKYDLLRNVYYNATVTKINGLGTPGENQINGDTGTPGNPGSPLISPDPILPTDPITPSKKVNIEATITIVPWTMHVADYEI